MREVGVRELRDHLSRYLTEVRDGRSFTITDHGKPVGRLVPAGQTTLERLIAEGKVTPAQTPHGRRELPEPIPVLGAGVSDLIDDQRR